MSSESVRENGAVMFVCVRWGCEILRLRDRVLALIDRFRSPPLRDFARESGTRPPNKRAVSPLESGMAANVGYLRDRVPIIGIPSVSCLS